MKKTPTYFERDWDGDRSRVVNKVNPACQWVADGEGVATRKLDGMCCAFVDRQYVKRRDIKKGKLAPDGFIEVEADPVTGKRVGWVPVGDGPEDQFFRDAIDAGPLPPDGTYELVGPKSQGGVEGYPEHMLIPHTVGALGLSVEQPPRDFDGLREWMTGRDIEGVVWHHPDGRMAKLKLRDFGLKRAQRRPH